MSAPTEPAAHALHLPAGSGRRAAGWRLLAALAAVAAACASQGAPPGGPPDTLPPQIERITPESGAVNVTPSRVIFHFDEVVSERPQGATTLSGLFLISPRHGQPDVDWHRTALAVRPTKGWLKNTVYTITMLPGIADLRGNVRKDGLVTIFSTGGSIPNTRLNGIVFDWVEGRPVARALVEAYQGHDTNTANITATDSTGRFTFLHLQPGTYTVRGYLDANSNRALDAREAWDSVSRTLRDTASAEILTFVHDTTGPAVLTVEVRDSVTLHLTLDRPLSPSQPIAPALFAVIGPDSARVPIAAALASREFEAREQARRDSAAAARPDTGRLQVDTGPRVGPPLRDTSALASLVAGGPAPSRPSPPKEIVLTLGRPLRPAAVYRLHSVGLRGLLGSPRTSDRTFNTPAAGAADSTRAGQPAQRGRPAAAAPPPRPPAPDTGRPPRANPPR